MPIVFYFAPHSSATPVACALAELGVPHEVARVDLAAGDQRKPEFLALNPNGKVPTLVVDGVPMFEALAILLWLGDRYGVEQGLWPAADAPVRPQAMAWSVWSYVTLGSSLGRLFYVTSDRLGPEYRHERLAGLWRNEIDGHLGVLEGQLARGPYLLGESFSLADLVAASTVGFGVFTGVSVAGFPRVRAWLERCQARPSFRSLLGG